MASIAVLATLATVIPGCSGGATDPDANAGGTTEASSGGGPTGGDGGSSGSSGTSGSSGMPTGPGAFAKGDPFDYAKVKTRSQMVASMLTAFGYATATTPKAVAVDAEGLGYVRVMPASGTQAEAESAALDACFVIGGAKACGLLASADKFVEDENKLAATLTHVLAKPAALADLPFVTASVRTTKTTAYKALTGFKALALSLDGTVVSAPKSSTNAALTTAAEAKRIALERCEMQATFAPCTVFAEGNDVPTYEPAAPTWAPQIRWTDKVVHISMPGTTDVNFNANVPGYLGQVANGQPGAIFLASDGAGGDQWGSGNVDALALAQCQQRVGPGFTCFKYAAQATVVMSPANIAAPTAAGVAHCESMPRTDCAAHLAMGCTTGMRYTTHTGSVKLEMCP